MNHRIQFSLVLMVFFMSAAALLFGWVYFDSVNKKYSELLRLPKDQNIGDLLSHIEQDQKKITILESQVKALQDNVMDLAKVQSSSPLTKVETVNSEVLSSTNKIDVYLDQKCLADKENLDECVILADSEMVEGVHAIIKPAKPLVADGVNTLYAEFYNSKGKITDFLFETDNLFDLLHPIVTIVYINRNDITLQYKTSPNNQVSVVNYDGSGWIEYQRSVTQADVNQ